MRDRETDVVFVWLPLLYEDLEAEVGLTETTLAVLHPDHPLAAEPEVRRSAGRDARAVRPSVVRCGPLPGDALPRSTSNACGLSCTASGSYPGVWNKVVVAREDDDETMLNHALIQGRRRHPT